MRCACAGRSSGRPPTTGTSVARTRISLGEYGEGGGDPRRPVRAPVSQRKGGTHETLYRIASCVLAASCLLVGEAGVLHASEEIPLSFAQTPRIRVLLCEEQERVLVRPDEQAARVTSSGAPLFVSSAAEAEDPIQDRRGALGIS